jgi:hypothetical protein
MTDYKQLCAELVAAWDDLPWQYNWKGDLTGIDGYPPDDSAVERARAALAEPEPEGPTQPIPVSERLPGPESRNSKGECWWLHPGDQDCGSFWTLFDGRYRAGCTHWLPAHAVPLPINE